MVFIPTLDHIFVNFYTVAKVKLLSKKHLCYLKAMQLRDEKRRRQVKKECIVDVLFVFFFILTQGEIQSLSKSVKIT